MQADASSIGFSISAYGTFRTCHGFQVESAFGSKGSFWRKAADHGPVRSGGRTDMRRWWARVSV
jgi:hypothetical protein